MATILGTLSELITPEAILKISKATGVDESIVAKGVGVAGPTVLGSLAQTAETTEGAASLMKMIPQEAGATSEAMLSSLLTSLAKGGASADVMNTTLGPGANAIASTLSRTAGFNIRPVLATLAPLVMGLVGKAVKTDKLDATGLSRMLMHETTTFMSDPANTEAARVVEGALQAGGEAAALRRTFDDVEWMKVRMAPLAALYLVGMASPSGMSGESQEIEAAANTVNDAVKNATPTSLLNTAFGNELTRNELDILKRDAPPNEKMLGTIKDAVRVVSIKDVAEAKAYGDLVMTVATNVAEAATERGFLGVGGKKVTAEEQATLHAIAAAIGR
jgi:hypothetical protein